MGKPAVLIGLAVVLTAALAFVFSRPEAGVSPDMLAGLVAVGVSLALVGRYTLGQFQINPGGALRDVLIWGAIIALVAVIYARRAAFGF